MKEFAERLKMLRQELNLTQNQLAEKTKISRSVISEWESGLKVPRADSVVVLAKFFKCSSDFLLGLED